MNWHKWVIILALSLLWLILLLQGIIAIVSIARAEEEDEPVETVRYWVICHPSSEVNVRERATTDSEIIGRLFLGDHVDVVRIKGRWAYCIGIGNESGKGWVHSGYLTDGEITLPDEPESAVISSNGRVAVRKSVDGGRKKWLAPGVEVVTIAYGGTWTLTDQGYVKTKFVGRAEAE